MTEQIVTKVSSKAITKRIERKLAPQGQFLKKNRRSDAPDDAKWFIVNRCVNPGWTMIVSQYANLTDVANSCGVLNGYEVIDE